MKRHRPSKVELIARLSRGLRPKLDAGQRRDLGLCHISNLDAIALGQANEQTLWDWVGAVLTWSKVAELLERGTDEMALQLDLATRLVSRYGATGRILFSGPDYQLAKAGVLVMDALAEIADRPTAIAGADWGEATLNVMSTACQARRAAEAPATERRAA